MGLNKLEEYLNEKKQSKDEKIEWEKRKKAWLSEVEGFFDQIVEWLEDFRQKDLLDYRIDDVQKHEENIGDYKTKKMIIHANDQYVDLDPVGTIIIGAFGRIDMISKSTNRSIKFVLVDKDTDGPRIKTSINGMNEQDEESQTDSNLEWKIATRAPQIKFIPLNEETFSNSLIEVLDG